MTQNAQTLTDKARLSTCRSFCGQRPDPRGESLTADPLLRGGLALFALQQGSTYTLGWTGTRSHTWSAVWKLLLTEVFHSLRCFWRAWAAGVRDLGHSVYITLALRSPHGWMAGPPNLRF